MKPVQRINTALEGGSPDAMPIFPIYDEGYFMKSVGRDVRDFIVASSDENVRYIEESFRRHMVDGFYVYSGTNDDFCNNHSIEKYDDYWLITEKTSGNQKRLLPEGCFVARDGKPLLMVQTSSGLSRIIDEGDIDVWAPTLTLEDIEATGRYRPLENLTQRYPDHHFAFQVKTPMAAAINACGGFVEGLITMATNRRLYQKLLERCTQNNLLHIELGKKYGAASMYFTSFYTGADTISPKDYAEIVFPFDLELCKTAKNTGLYVLNWYLGDLMPMLDQVKKLPLHALVLEQSRKGYEIDPVEIRHHVGKELCIFGYGYERDFCECNFGHIEAELRRQIYGAGLGGAFIAGTTIVPPDADEQAVEFYFTKARQIGEEFM